MIARLIRWKRRLELEADIRSMENDLAAIAEQRKNDDAAEEVITDLLVRAKRLRQAMAHAELQQKSKDLTRHPRL